MFSIGDKVPHRYSIFNHQPGNQYNYLEFGNYWKFSITWQNGNVKYNYGHGHMDIFKLTLSSKLVIIFEEI